MLQPRPLDEWDRCREDSGAWPDGLPKQRNRLAAQQDEAAPFAGLVAVPDPFPNRVRRLRQSFSFERALFASPSGNIFGENRVDLACERPLLFVQPLPQRS